VWVIPDRRIETVVVTEETAADPIPGPDRNQGG
jgi:hypothetical protein